MTLPVSTVISEWTTFANYLFLDENLKTTNVTRELVDSFIGERVATGSVKVRRFKKALLDVNSLSETSTATVITKPEMGEEYMELTVNSVIPVSFSEELIATAVTNGSLIGDTTAYFISLIGTTKTADLRLTGVSLLSEILQDTQRVVKEIEVTSLSGLSGADYVAVKKDNADVIAEEINSLVVDMGIEHSTYNSQGALNTVNPDDLVLYINNKWKNKLKTRLADVFHKGDVEALMSTGKVVVLPDSQVDIIVAGNERGITSDTFVGILCEKKTAEIFFGYDGIQLEFKDPSTLYTNVFAHYQYGFGVWGYKDAVTITADEA